MEVLAGAGVRATFFLQGRWVTAFPAIARRIAEGGHLIASHSFYHVPIPLLGEPALRADLTRAEQAIADVTGVDAKPWFRCPFGIGAKDADVVARLDGLGYRHVHWDVNPLDWRKGRSAAAVENAVVHGVMAREHTPVVVMHTWAAPTPVALPKIIERLRAEEVTFVTVDEWWQEIERAAGR